MRVFDFRGPVATVTNVPDRPQPLPPVRKKATVQVTLEVVVDTSRLDEDWTIADEVQGLADDNSLKLVAFHVVSVK